jgi:hypothetical protein
MIGEPQFTVIEPGRSYKLSDGTELTFLTRDGNGVAGLSAEELIGVLVDRLESLKELNGADHRGQRAIALARTDLQSAENWLNRWDLERRAERKRSAGILFEQRGVRVSAAQLQPA